MRLASGRSGSAARGFFGPRRPPAWVVDEVAYLTDRVAPAVGGLPLGTQGKAMAMFSGGIDSPVAAFMAQHRGVDLDYLHFSLGCGQADHAAGIAYHLFERHGAGTEPELVVVDLEGASAAIQEGVTPRDRQMALKAVMYRAAEGVMRDTRGARALVTGESLGQVSTQTLDNLVALDRLVDTPVLRPLLGLDKAAIRRRAESIGTYELSARTRELCDIAGGARVSVSTSARRLRAIAEDLTDLVDEVVTTAKRFRLADWVPGGEG